MVIKNRIGFWSLFCLMPVGLGLLGFSALTILDRLLDNGKHPFINNAAEIEHRQFVMSIVFGAIGYIVGLIGGWKLARELFAERTVEVAPEPADPSAIHVRK